MPQIPLPSSSMQNESTMNAEGIRRYIEEKEAIATTYNQLSAHSAKLEKECTLYERDLERAMESCDELAKENDEICARLNKAEEEVKLLFEENKILDEENKRLLCLLEKERQHRSERKHSASNSKKIDAMQ